MVVYFACFALSVACLYIKERVEVSKFTRWILLVVAILLPCICAALRADTIGTDINVYLKNMFACALDSNNVIDFYSKSWFSVWRYKYITEFEPAFTFLVYVVSKCTHSLACVLGVIELCTVIPVYVAIKKFRPQIPAWIGMLVFYAMFYNISLNLMRQMISCGLCLLAFVYFMNSLPKKGFLILLIAFFFHRMAIIGVLLYLIHLFITRTFEFNPKKKSRFLKKMSIRYEGKVIVNDLVLRTIIISLLFTGFIIMLPSFIRFLPKIGLSRYVNYLNGELKLMPNQLLLRLPLLALPIFFRKDFMKNKTLYYYFITIQLVELILSQLAGIYEQTIRMNYFISICFIVIIPYFCRYVHKEYRYLVKGYYGIYLAAYWYYYYAFLKIMETVPYAFRF